MRTTRAPGLFGCEECLLPPARLKDLALDRHLVLSERSDFRQTLCKCRHCGQIFLEDSREAPSGRAGTAEDVWFRWYPLAEHTWWQVRSRGGATPELLRLLQEGPHLNLGPGATFYWATGLTGARIVPVLGLR